jgi:hypothetical protein
MDPVARLGDPIERLDRAERGKPSNVGVSRDGIRSFSCIETNVPINKLCDYA